MWPRSITLLILLGSLGALSGCGSDDAEVAGVEGLDESASSARLEGMSAFPDRPNHEQLADLIRSLRSDDPLVRSAAIYTLRRVTKTDLGFVADDPESVREAAADRWDHWLEQRGASSVE